MSAGSSPLLSVERPFPGCALLTLDRPAARNALSRALRRELAAAFERLGIEDGLRVSLDEGLQIERRRASRWAATLVATELEERRGSVTARGRSQQQTN